MNLSKYKSIVVLTGAGISAESGIKTFRDQNGLWENHSIEKVASPEGFRDDPKLVLNFYNMRRSQLLSPQVQPNLAHKSLAKFQKKYGGKFTLITQNIDNLHERAGSIDVIHMHGELLKVRCQSCQYIFETETSTDLDTSCPQCAIKGQIRPHIVWFGEVPFHITKIEDALKHCEIFITIGTSAQVYPAAGFYQLAKSYGAQTIECNLESTQVSSYFDQNYFGKATETVPKLLST